MIRDYEVNPEHIKNPRAPLWRFPESPLAPTKQEQYSWALNDYFDSVLQNGTAFPSYVTRGLNKLPSDFNEIKRQDEAHRTYMIPVVNHTMENIRRDLENKIQGNLEDYITTKRIGIRFPSMTEQAEERLVNHPLEKQLVEEYLRSRFGN